MSEPIPSSASDTRRPVPGLRAFLVGVSMLIIGAAANFASQAMGIQIAESLEPPSTGDRFAMLILAEIAAVMFYAGLAPLLAGAIRYGVSKGRG